MRLSGLLGSCLSVAFVIGTATTALAQSPEPQAETRQSTIEKAAGEKSQSLHPYEVSFAEKVIAGLERRLTNQATVRWHPYFQNAYEGGGFAAGLGYTFHTSAYSTVDVRGSYSISSYKLAEAEYRIAAAVRQARRADHRRRMAGCDRGRIPRRWHKHVE